MKKKRILCTLILSIVFIISSIMMSTASYATEMIFGVKEFWTDTDPDSKKTIETGYKVSQQQVWKIYKRKNEEELKSLVYCLRAGKGFYQNKLEPNKYTNLYKDSKDFKKKDEMQKAGVNILEDLNAHYKSVLWILDNSYISTSKNASEDKKALLKKACEKYGGVDQDYESDPDEAEKNLTNADIEMIQQLAIWYFTNEYITDNRTGKEEDKDTRYHYNFAIGSQLPQVEQKVNGKGDYNNIDKDQNTAKYAAMKTLYKYLVDEAKIEDNLKQYDGENISSAPISLAKNEELTNELKAEYDETTSKYILGPYKIKQNNTLPCSWEAVFKTKDGTKLEEYQLLDESKKPVKGTIKELINKEFYISVSKEIANDTNKIDFSIEGTYNITNMKYWTSLNAQSDTQPLVEVEREDKTIEETVSVTIEKIPDKIFDLALRKYITDINGQPFNRAPTVDPTPLKATPVDLNNHTAIYSHLKEPITVKSGDIITYTIRVYNEGEIDAFVGEITDYLPEELEFINDPTNYPDETSFNAKNGWVIDSNNERIIKTTKLKKSNNESNDEQNKIPAFDGTTLSYKDIQIKCKVKETVKSKKITNLAQITVATDTDGNNVADVDSEANGGFTLPQDTQLPSYKDDEWDQVKNGNKYVPGQEDDDDYEKVIIKNFDLALRKYITELNGAEVMGRIPEPNVAPLNNGTASTALYNHPKKPLKVQIGDIVTFTIRIYNEGEINGYASKITDYLPKELEFINDPTNYPDETSFNEKYDWSPSEDGRTVTTDYLSKEKEETEGANLIEAFDGTTLDSKYVKIKCKVKDTAEAGVKITNIATVTECKDENGNDVTDRDSNPKTVPEAVGDDTKLPKYKDSEIESGDKYIPGEEDDDDFEKLILKGFDLALRKYITELNGTEIMGRIPEPDIKPLNNGKSTAIYKGSKQPLTIKTGDVVTYTIRVYNEGEIDGYASKITDHLPKELEFIKDDKEVNEKYDWTVSEDGRTVTTDYLSKEKEETEGANLIGAFDGTKLDSKYVEIRCKVKGTESSKSKIKITNIATITENTDKEGKPIKDKDSDPNKVPEEIGDDTKLPPYKDQEISKGETYIPGQEDDDDFEKLVTSYFDLALRKFITGIEGKKITSRIPKVSMGEDGNLKYEHTKTPLEVVTGNTIEYTIRVYNEGLINGYASEIVDNVPEGLQFLPDNETNREYRWDMYEEVSSKSKEEDLFEYAGKKYKKTTKAEDADIIKTDYLSKEQEKTEGANLIKAFDVARQISETNPDYKEVLVKFKVTEKDPSKTPTNIAEISDDRDEDNKPVEDSDSEPGNGKGEDDLDKEYIKVQIFDLALKKWVSKVIIIEGDQQTVTDTGHTGNEDPEPIVKVDLHKKKLNQVTVKFEFQIKVINEGQIEGYAKEVTDYIPEGLKFIQEDNQAWYTREALNGRERVATKALENKLLKPGESASVPIVLTWVNDPNNMGLKNNIAEISKDYNDKGAPDKDSTPDNFKDKEDDQDDAPVMLAIILGKDKIFVGITLLILATIGTGIFLIKKYVIL